MGPPEANMEEIETGRGLLRVTPVNNKRLREQDRAGGPQTNTQTWQSLSQLYREIQSRDCPSAESHVGQE